MPSPASKSPKITRRGFLGAIASGLVAGSFGSVYAKDSAEDLQLVRRDLKLPRWDAEGFRLGLIADLHMNRKAEAFRATRAVEMVMAEKPDVIVIAGDFLDSSKENVLAHIPLVLALLGDAPCPVLAVMGNHDYWTYQPGKVISSIEATTVKLLRNQTFEHEGVTIVGVDDAIAGKDRYDFFPSTSRSTLAVLHEPDNVQEMPEHVSLQVSGHSHGGQICLPFGIPLHTPLGARRYRSGFYPDAKVPLYVTRGVGTTGPNYRLFCRPEVSILTLRSA